MQVTLKLIPKHTRQPLRKAVAWFVSGGDPSTWLRELNRSGLPLESIQLRPIPRSFHENSPIGVLVTPGHAGQEFAQQIRSHSQNAWSQSGKALAYGLVAGRLFVPIDTRLFPDVSDVDVTQLLPADDSEFVWHPSTGLLRMDSPERLRVDELFVPPDERIAVWDKAIPGTAFRSRVISIQADNELTADSIVQQGRGDIGQRSASPDQLPPTPGEWFKGRLGQWAKSLREALTPRPRLPTDKPADQLGSAAVIDSGSRRFCRRGPCQWRSRSDCCATDGVGVRPWKRPAADGTTAIICRSDRSESRDRSTDASSEERPRSGVTVCVLRRKWRESREG